MDKDIIRFDKCNVCNTVTEYFVRADNINSCLTDSDILMIVSARSERPDSYDYCEKCKFRTLTTTMGFKGLE